MNRRTDRPPHESKTRNLVIRTPTKPDDKSETVRESNQAPPQSPSQPTQPEDDSSSG